MMEIQASVLQVNPDGSAWVQSSAEGGSCHSCGSGSGSCGSGNIGRMFAPKQEQRYRVLDQVGCKPGDQVIINIADGSVLRGAVIVYMLPLLLVFFCALVAHRLASPAMADTAAILGASVGFVLASLVVGILNRRASHDPRYQPAIVRRIHRDFVVLKEIRS